MGKRIAAASNGKHAVAVRILGDNPCLWKYAPKSAGGQENNVAFDLLIVRAAAKLGYKPDRRCKGDWRYVGGIQCAPCAAG
jgi:hypothetical protein